MKTKLKSILAAVLATVGFAASAIQIYVRPEIGADVTLDVETSDSIGKVKTMVQDKLAIPPAAQTLKLDGTQLEDNKTLADYNIQPGSTLHLFVTPPPEGSQGNPWAVGLTADDTVIAWTNGTGKLVVEGSGAMTNFTVAGSSVNSPWYSARSTITAAEIGPGVTSIGDMAFRLCNKLKEVTIPESVTSIGAYAFAQSALADLTIPEAVTSIGDSAFNYASSLTNVTVQAVTPPTLGSQVFGSCSKLKTVAVPLWTGAAYRHTTDWNIPMVTPGVFVPIVEPEAPKPFVPGHAVDSNQVGVCSWTWHADMETVLAEMADDGRYNGMQLALAPWLGIDDTGTHFGEKESGETWEFIKQKIGEGSLNVMATMINFPKEDYTSMVSITNTLGYTYGVKDGRADADEQWASNLFYTAEAARLTRELGVKTLTAEIGFVCVDEDVMFERMTNVCQVCSENGVQFLIESGPQNSLYMTNLLVRLNNAGYTNVGINYDPGDTRLFFADDAWKAYQITKPWIRMIHVRGCRANVRTQPGWNEDITWGDGIVSSMIFSPINEPLTRFIPRLKQDGYAGNILYERMSGDATLTEKRKAQITKAMDRIFLDLAGKVWGTPEFPFGAGEGVEAYTNGTELVISGGGTVDVLDEMFFRYADRTKLTAITINAGVTDAAANAFKGGVGMKGPVALTLPSGWQGAKPDADGNWYGAKNVKLATSVKNVTFQQRYPWNGMVDISCDLSGAGEVTLKVAALTNGVEFVEAMTLIGETTVDLEAAGGATNGVKFIWNAAADLPAGFKASGVAVKVTAEK